MLVIVDVMKHIFDKKVLTTEKNHDKLILVVKRYDKNDIDILFMGMLV
jgi:hypothetical protein